MGGDEETVILPEDEGGCWLEASYLIYTLACVDVIAPAYIQNEYSLFFGLLGLTFGVMTGNVLSKAIKLRRERKQKACLLKNESQDTPS